MSSRAFCVFVRADNSSNWWQSELMNCTSVEAFARRLLTEPVWFQFREEPMQQWLCAEDDAPDATQFIPSTMDWARLWINALRAAAPLGADACTLQLELLHPGAPYIIIEEDACGAPVAESTQRLSLCTATADDTDVENDNYGYDAPCAQPQLTWQVILNAAAFSMLLQQASENWQMFERVNDESGHHQWTTMQTHTL